MRDVVCSSPWIPVEWIRAHGLQPRGLWSREVAIGQGRMIAAGRCAFAESALRLSRAGDPDTAFVFSTQCDQLRRSYDDSVRQGSSADPPRVFLFNLPATWQTPVAERMLVSEMKRLGHFMEAVGGKPPTAQLLAEVSARQNKVRGRLLQEVQFLPAREAAEAVTRGLFGDGGACASSPLNRSHVCRPSPRIPLAIIGGPMSGSQWQLLEIIERAGGQVVLNATEPGERHLWVDPELEHCPGELTLEDQLLRLARAYASHCIDVYQRPNSKLYSWLKQRLAERNVRGILLWHEVWCDLWRAEVQTIRERFSLPVLQLDSEHLDGDGLRNTGRLEAFLESLE